MEEIRLWLQSLFILAIFQSTDLRKPELTFPHDQVMGMTLLMAITADLQKVEHYRDTT